MFAFLFIILLSASSQSAVYRRIGNKIYSSNFDKDMFLIAPDDNQTIAHSCSYDMYFVCPNEKNYTIYYNDTAIEYKDSSIKALHIIFFANDSIFNINVRTSNESRFYIIIYYSAKGGFIPIPPVTPPFPDEFPQIPEFIWGLTNTEVFQLGLMTSGLICLIIITGGFSVKIYKEKTIVEIERSPGMEYYRGD